MIDIFTVACWVPVDRYYTLTGSLPFPHVLTCPPSSLLENCMWCLTQPKLIIRSVSKFKYPTWPICNKWIDWWARLFPCMQIPASIYDLMTTAYNKLHYRFRPMIPSTPYLPIPPTFLHCIYCNIHLTSTLRGSGSTFPSFNHSSRLDPIQSPLVRRSECNEGNTTGSSKCRVREELILGRVA